MSTDTAGPGPARARLADQLTEHGDLRSPAIQAAFRAVPRHLFLPGTPVADAYTDEVVVTKRDADGNALSSASQPTIVARMLEQARPRPGQRVLEIGAGTGYNAALLRELVGGTGQVTTIDIYDDVVHDARRNLAATGYGDVQVRKGDGADGAPDRAPFDLIVVTAGAWDIPAAWWAQLAPHGRVVVPLRWRGLTRSLALDHRPGPPASLTATSLHLCGFIAMTGPSDGERAVPIADDVVLMADEDQDFGDLHGVLDQPRAEVWSGVVIGGDQSLEGIWLRMAAAEPGTCRIKAAPIAVATGRVNPATTVNPALAEHGSLAYLAIRRTAEDNSRGEIGAITHGPHAEDLGERIVAQVRAWAAAPDAHPAITLYPAATPAHGPTVPKRDSVLLMSW
ncbi:methyltransferase, FxLD system [Actinomadura hibisca]|uniref:methyltransferase, FxLD system n=1 Tax=Actinomadura hibisca TaxID=68565 RepID=UPI0008364AE3|nr:methyltransferase, FxLD system [Actinomadura hibisca]